VENEFRSVADVDAVFHDWQLEFDVPRVRDILNSIKLKKITDKISEWAPENRTLPAGTPFEGPWQNSKTPFMVEIMDELSSSSSTEVISIMKCAQIGATAGSAENKIGATIDFDPGPILYITATEKLAAEWSGKRLDPLIDLCGLGNRLGPTVVRKGKRSGSGDKVYSKDFPGGYLIITAYKSVGMLRSMPFQIVIFDEIDSAPVDVNKEGDPRKIGEARTSNYERRKKILILSTPILKQTSKILKAFEEGDMRYYHVPCPDCKKLIKFDLIDDAGKCNLVFKMESEHNINEDSVHYPCPECGFKIKNYHKTGMYESGKCKWIPSNPHARKRNKSYFINACYGSPGMVSFETLAQEYVSAEGDEEDMKAFVNLRAGLPWEEKGETPTIEQTMEKKGAYTRGTRPENVLMVTAGGDLHKDRLDVEIKGFDGMGSYSIEWMHFFGNPTTNKGGSLYKFMKAFQNKELPGNPKIAFVDSKYQPKEVHKMAFKVRGIYAIKGEEWINGGVPFIKSTLDQYGGMEYVRVNTGLIKTQIMNSLMLQPFAEGDYPEGYMHFPNDYEDAFFEQLNSEARFPEENKKTGKVTGFVWKEIHSKGNHALDCNVYAMAASDFLLYKMAQAINLEKDYEQIIWKILRDPKKLGLLKQSGV
jgi:phage terminase large subunit GpA-like protein